MQHPVPLFVGEGGKGAVTDDAGIADHTVIGAVFGHVGLQPRAATLAIGDVELDQAPLPTGRLQAGQRRLGTGAVAVVVHHDEKTVGGQLEGDGAAYPLAGARDQYGRDHETSFANKSDNSPGAG
ncbi:hypothetical protein D3C86_1477530 [compost metagenome]